MRGIELNFQGNKGVLDKVSIFEANCKKEGTFAAIYEPTFVLDTRSPSPSTSTSTLSSSLGGGGTSSAGGCDNNSSLVLISENPMNHKWPETEKDEWAAELEPISGAGSPKRIGTDDWESWLSESAKDQPMRRWISGDVDDTPLSLNKLLHSGNGNDIENDSNLEPWGNADDGMISNLNSSLGVFSSALAPNSRVLNCNPNSKYPNLGMPHQLQIVNQGVLNHDISSLLPISNCTPNYPNQFEPQLKRHNLGFINCNAGVTRTPADEFLLSKPLPQMNFARQLTSLPPHQMNFARQLTSLPPHQLLHKSFIAPKQDVAGGFHEQISTASHLHQHQQQGIYDQLCKTAEFILSGNFSHAQAILARLNHQLSNNTKPFQRAAFYFKEALQMYLLLISNPGAPIPSRIPTPVDGMFKIGAYKVLSEVSPLIQFMNFTSNQAILEALGNADSIHIVDFDIGFGAQWSSFMQELPRKDRCPPSLKITAFASPTTHHPIELGLMHENLTEFATNIGISFELEIVNIDSFDPSSYSIPHQSSQNDAIAVNFPVWSTFSHLPALPSLVSFIKQLSPKIIVSMDRGCERIEFPYPQHLLHTLQYYEMLLDSLDAANVTLDALNKIERFLFQPKVENMVLGRLNFPDQMPPWKSLLASMGFSLVAFSNFSETQAECLIKRTQVRGFHVEKHEGSLFLCWQHRQLMSVSAWRC